MTASLETAYDATGLRRVAIDPVTRVEGHGKVTLLLDDDHHIHQARLHIVEFRGFEKFIQGRPYWELPVLVQRLCGICPVSHHLAAAKAIDEIIGVDQLTPTAERIRHLMHYGQTLQSHALHFFHLSSPDLLFGFDDPVVHRNVVGLIQDCPELALKGVRLRKFGQEVIRVTSGKRVHGTGAIPGGVNKAISITERDELLADIDQIVDWSQEAVALFESIYAKDRALHREFGNVPANTLSLVRSDGALEIYHGGLRARTADGETLFDHQDYRNYRELMEEQVKSWSFMKFPYLTQLGPEQGWYRVGPLARVNNCDFISTPLAEQQRRNFRAASDGGLSQAALMYHWARMIELLYCAEAIRDLLHDPVLVADDLVVQHGTLQSEGIGVIEAPRGTLFHHYQVDGDGLVTRANLIVSTTNNNQAMNEAIRQVANQYLDGRQLNEPALNRVEIAIRAYDPCLSCATHALGKMPLELELLDGDGNRIQRIGRQADGTLFTE